MQRQPTGIIHDRKKNLGADPCAGTRTASKREMAFVECPGNEVLARDKELELRQEVGASMLHVSSSPALGGHAMRTFGKSAAAQTVPLSVIA